MQKMYLKYTPADYNHNGEFTGKANLFSDYTSFSRNRKQIVHTCVCPGIDQSITLARSLIER